MINHSSGRRRWHKAEGAKEIYKRKKKSKVEERSKERLKEGAKT